MRKECALSTCRLRRSRTWEASKPYVMQPFEKRGELDQGILRFTWYSLVLVAKGYAIFYPNIRGSIGYGQKFTELNRGDWGGADFRDVVAGIEDLIHRGIADAREKSLVRNASFASVR